MHDRNGSILGDFVDHVLPNVATPKYWGPCVGRAQMALSVFLQDEERAKKEKEAEERRAKEAQKEAEERAKEARRLEEIKAKEEADHSVLLWKG